MVKIQCELAIDSIHHVVILVKLVNSLFASKKHYNALQVCSMQWFAFRLLRDTSSATAGLALDSQCALPFQNPAFINRPE